MELIDQAATALYTRFGRRGVVEAVGEGVTRIKPGDRVYTARTVSGAYAEYTLALESQVHALPEKISFAQGRSLGSVWDCHHCADSSCARAAR